MSYLDNIVFSCKVISNNGCNLWEDLMAVLVADTVLSPEVKTAIYSVLKKRSSATAASPIHFEREILSLLDAVQNKGWNDLEMPNDLLPALTVELRTYILNQMVSYIATKLAEANLRITDILGNNGLLPATEQPEV